MKNIYKYLSIVIFFFIFQASVLAQTDQYSFAQQLDSVFTKGIEQQLTPGGLLVIARADSILFSKGYGYADVDNKIPVDAEKTLFQLGSIGKIFTAIAALQMAEQGKLDLNHDINQYLDTWKINNPYNTPLTLTHLLTHSGGFDERVIGYMAKRNDAIEPLNQHLSQRMPSLYQAPGKEINYSNYGYGLAGLLVEKASGQSFTTYVKQHILEPLGMHQSTYQLPDDWNHAPQFAKGYRTRETFEFIASYPRHVPPAGSILSTASDMGKLLQALLQKDSFITRAHFDKIFQKQFASHPLLTGYSLGFEAQTVKGNSIISKGGSVPGFQSEIIIIPELNLGIFITINTQTDNILDSLAQAIKLWLPTRDINFPAIIKNTDLERFTGVYRNNRCNHNTIEDVLELFQSPINVNKTKDGKLSIAYNGHYFIYQAINDSVFQQTENPERFLVFSNLDNNKAQSLYTSLEINGWNLPVSYARLDWYETPRFINDDFPAIVMPIIGAYFIIPIFWFFAWILRKIKPNILRIPRLKPIPHAVALIFTGLFIWHLAGFFFPFLKRREELLFGMPQDLYIYKYLHWAMIGCILFILYYNIRIWVEKQSWIGMRIFYSLFTLAGIAYLLFLYRWHFLSMAN